MQTVPWIFGVAHPTGFPFFTVAAGIFAHAIPFGTAAWRITFFCAIAMACAALFIALLVRELSGDMIAACLSAWLFAFGNVAWVHGTRAEVHAVAVCLCAAVLYAMVRWRNGGDDRALVLGGLAFGFGVATHPIVALLTPALVVGVLSRRRNVHAKPLACAALACLLGVAFYAYLPLRSAMVTAQGLDPARGLGLLHGNAFWDFDHPAKLDGLLLLLSGSQFGAGGTFARMIDPSTYAAALSPYVTLALREGTPFGVLLALGGLYWLFRRDAWLGATFVLAAALPTAFAFAYTIEADISRYYLISFVIGAVLAGYGAAAIGRALPQLRLPATLVLLSLSATVFAMNRQTFDQRAATGAQSVIDTARKHSPADAILIAPWLYATPLAYGAYAEHTLDRRIVLAAWLSDVRAFVPQWMRHRPVYIVATVNASIPGYVLRRISGSPDLYQVVRP